MSHKILAQLFFQFYTVKSFCFCKIFFYFHILHSNEYAHIFVFITTRFLIVTNKIKYQTFIYFGWKYFHDGFLFSF